VFVRARPCSSVRKLIGSAGRGNRTQIPRLPGEVASEIPRPMNARARAEGAQDRKEAAGGCRRVCGFHPRGDFAITDRKQPRRMLGCPSIDGLWRTFALPAPLDAPAPLGSTWTRERATTNGDEPAITSKDPLASADGATEESRAGRGLKGGCAVSPSVTATVTGRDVSSPLLSSPLLSSPRLSSPLLSRARRGR